MAQARTNAKTAAALTVGALLVWLVCGLTIAVGRNVVGVETTLVVHAVGATAPLRTAAFFVSFAVILDATLVALAFEKSYAMFASVLGTWAPLALIFAARYLTALRATRIARARA